MKMFELSHWQYDSISRWRKARPWSAPTKLVKVRVCNEERSYPTERLLDMGAQVVIVRMRWSDLEPIILQLKTANNFFVNVIGGLIAETPAMVG